MKKTDAADYLSKLADCLDDAGWSLVVSGTYDDDCTIQIDAKYGGIKIYPSGIPKYPFCLEYHDKAILGVKLELSHKGRVLTMRASQRKPASVAATIFRQQSPEFLSTVRWW